MPTVHSIPGHATTAANHASFLSILAVIIRKTVSNPDVLKKSLRGFVAMLALVRILSGIHSLRKSARRSTKVTDENAKKNAKVKAEV